MPRSTADVLEAALELPLDERAKVAAELLASLDTAGSDVDAAWASEIARRVDAARAGELASTDWRTVLARVENDVLGR